MLIHRSTPLFDYDSVDKLLVRVPLYDAAPLSSDLVHITCVILASEILESSTMLKAAPGNYQGGQSR